MSNAPFSKVLGKPALDPNAKARLVCFPFAGGSALVYRDWKKLLPAHFEVCPVELPGHGARMNEPSIDDLDRLTTELASALSPLFDRPVILFGHSLGGRVAFALARREPRVRALIASASQPPHLPPSRLRFGLSRDALLGELARLGGTPPAVLAEPELMDLFLPVFRADFGLLERGLAPADARVSCPIVCIAARDDAEVPFDRANDWASRTSGSFRLVEVTGGHFFLESRRDVVFAEITRILEECSRGAPVAAT